MPKVWTVLPTDAPGDVPTTIFISPLSCLFSVLPATTCYPDSMISYKRNNALQPEKESVVQFDLMPLLVFALGFLMVRSLLSAVKAELS